MLSHRFSAEVVAAWGAVFVDLPAFFLEFHRERLTVSWRSPRMTVNFIVSRWREYEAGCEIVEGQALVRHRCENVAASSLARSAGELGMTRLTRTAFPSARIEFNADVQGS